MTDNQDKTDEWLFSELRFVDRAMSARWGLSDKQSRDEYISFQHQQLAIKAEIESRGLQWRSNE